jgi:hypothetical protein
MKHTLIHLSILVALVSCGSQESNSQNISESNPLGTTGPTTEESELKERLVKKGSIEQLELIKELGSLATLNEASLKRLDKYIEIQCLQSNGLCYVTKRN